MDVCGVCCEIFNKTNHKKVTCPFCDLSACKTCCQTYLLSSIEDPHCFKCKNLWNREFVDSSVHDILGTIYIKLIGKMYYLIERKFRCPKHNPKLSE